MTDLILTAALVGQDKVQRHGTQGGGWACKISNPEKEVDI